MKLWGLNSVGRNSRDSARGSRDSARSSLDSMHSATSHDNAHIKRSSFALERASLEVRRFSVEMFGPERATVNAATLLAMADIDALCQRLGVPAGMKDRYLRLCVIPKDMPVPVAMLAKLWGIRDEMDAEATANLMQERGIMRVACLEDGSAWALVQPDHLASLQVRAAPQAHL